MMSSKMTKVIVIVLVAVVLVNVKQGWAKKMDTDSKYKEATFAGGCFWCMEPPFHNENGVIDVTSGYAHGSKRDADYKKVSSGRTDHYEAVQVIYDPEIVSYERLLEVFWWNIDPTDEYGQFYDKGKHYRTAIFYHDDSQKAIASKSKEDLGNSGKFKDPIKTEVLPYKSFYAAEDYHQDYYKTNSDHYNRYKKGSGREDYIKNTWGNEMKKHAKKQEDSGENLKGKLSDMQYYVTQECGTEPPFNNAYWNNKDAGIYVDVVDGTPLFSSTDKYDSGTGWPSFTKPIDEKLLTTRDDLSLYVPRIEVRSEKADSHLGHVFEDGKSSTGKRFCINSASLLFIPKEELAEKGYEKYVSLFE